MTAARALANQKLYYAAIHQRMLSAELAREDIPAAVLLEAVGQSVRQHLLDAYGWFLLELAEIEELPALPPHTVAELLQQWPQQEPLRGELVELMGLEQTPGWLAELHLPVAQSVPGTAAPADTLVVVDAQWSQPQLEGWYNSLVALIERMSDSLDEW